jgi:hypothetical protein
MYIIHSLLAQGLAQQDTGAQVQRVCSSCHAAGRWPAGGIDWLVH